MTRLNKISWSQKPTDLEIKKQKFGLFIFPTFQLRNSFQSFFKNNFFPNNHFKIIFLAFLVSSDVLSSTSFHRDWFDEGTAGKRSDAVVVVDVVAAFAVAAVKGSEDDDGFLVQGQEPSLLSCRRAPSWQRSTWSSAAAAAAAAWKNNASDNFFSIKLFFICARHFLFLRQFSKWRRRRCRRRRQRRRRRRHLIFASLVQSTVNRKLF